MQLSQLSEFTRGWLIGNFEPTLLATSEFEVGIKYYTAGDCEAAHFHKRATEYTVIGAGKFHMNGQDLESGAIVILKPNEIAHFKCLEAGHTIIIKVPSVPGDKYLATEI